VSHSNCKSENVRAGTRRATCRRVPASLANHRAETIPLAVPFAAFPFGHSHFELYLRSHSILNALINTVISRYLEEELPEFRHSTGEAYSSYLANHIKPRWGSQPIEQIKPLGVEQMAEANRPSA